MSAFACAMHGGIGRGAVVSIDCGAGTSGRRLQAGMLQLNGCSYCSSSALAHHQHDRILHSITLLRVNGRVLGPRPLTSGRRKFL